MVDENQVEQYVNAIKVDALRIEDDAQKCFELKQTTVENSEAYHKLALQWAFNAFCCHRAHGEHGSIGDKAKLYSVLSKVAETLGVKMPL